MSDTRTKEQRYRWERIERLLDELKYECMRGMMEGEIDETIGFTFIVPHSKNLAGGVVRCDFRTRPMHAHSIGMMDHEPPKLRVVK